MRLTHPPLEHKICVASAPRAGLCSPRVSKSRRPSGVSRTAPNDSRRPETLHPSTEPTERSCCPMQPRRLNAVEERRSALKTALLCLCLVAATAAGAGAWVSAHRAAQSTPDGPKDMGVVSPGETRRQSIDGGEWHVYRVAVAR